MEQNSEISIIQRARLGDQDAISRLYETTKNYAYFVARRYLQNDEDIADILQDAYISVFSNLGKFEDGKPFKPWLHAIVTNKCLNLIKSKSAIFVSQDEIGELASDNEELIPAAWLERTEKRRDIMRIIDGLPDGQHMAITLFYFESLSIAEIAEAMGVAEGTVKAHLYHGRKNIKEEVFREEKKGNKLCAIVPLPLLTQLFELEAEAAMMPEAMSKAVWEGTVNSLTAEASSPPPIEGEENVQEQPVDDDTAAAYEYYARELETILASGNNGYSVMLKDVDRDGVEELLTYWEDIVTVTDELFGDSDEKVYRLDIYDWDGSGETITESRLIELCEEYGLELYQWEWEDSDGMRIAEARYQASVFPYADTQNDIQRLLPDYGQPAVGEPQTLTNANPLDEMPADTSDAFEWLSAIVQLAQTDDWQTVFALRDNPKLRDFAEQHSDEKGFNVYLFYTDYDERITVRYAKLDDKQGCY